MGSFVAEDVNNFNGTWRNFLRVRVQMDVGQPLKRRMRIEKRDCDWIWVEFRYERLPNFCFICGCLGHIDRKCKKLYDSPDGNVLKPYGVWM